LEFWTVSRAFAFSAAFSAAVFLIFPFFFFGFAGSAGAAAAAAAAAGLASPPKLGGRTHVFSFVLMLTK
jgi:hypothetical protein